MPNEAVFVQSLLTSAATREEIVSAIERSGLRGRGGAGFPTGQKWRVVSQQDSDTKYVICNGDEGDPGAFMDRMILESFPFRVIEGLAIAAVAVGAHEGIFYIRHEYPLAVKRIRAAIAEMEKRGWLHAKEHWTPNQPLTPALSLRERENRSQSPAITSGGMQLPPREGEGERLDKSEFRNPKSEVNQSRVVSAATKSE